MNCTILQYYIILAPIYYNMLNYSMNLLLSYIIQLI